MNVVSRICWGTALLLQAALIALLLFSSIWFAASPPWVVILARLVAAAPLIGLTINRPLLHRAVWVVLLLAALALTVVGAVVLGDLSLSGLSQEAFVLRALFGTVQAVCLLGSLVYTFSSSRWHGPNNSFKPKPLRGSA